MSPMAAMIGAEAPDSVNLNRYILPSSKAAPINFIASCIVHLPMRHPSKDVTVGIVWEFHGDSCPSMTHRNEKDAIVGFRRTRFDKTEPPIHADGEFG